MKHKMLAGLGFMVCVIILSLDRTTAQAVDPSKKNSGVTESTSTIYMTLTWERSRETDVTNGGCLGCGVEAGRQLATYPDFNWDDGTYTPGVNRNAVPSVYRWASWQQKYTVDIRRLKGTFIFPANLDPATTEGVLFDPFYDTDLIPINDNLYVYLNGVLVFTGGTNYGALNGGMNGTSQIANEADGWYIPNGITLTGFQAGTNTVDIVVEERATWGGIGYLMLRFGPRTSNIPIPFLDLPIDYSYTNFAKAAKGNVGVDTGRVNSWFDHTYPTYGASPNAGTNNITTWSGAPYTITPTMTITDFRKGIGIWWYDGHNGIDFQQRTQNETILAAAPGTVISTTLNPLVTHCKEGKDKVRSCGNSYGNQVWIDHDNGYATLYAHLRTVSVTVGITVTTSQPLGIMGDTGNSDGAHLHFGLYYDQNSDGQWTSRVTQTLTQTEVVDPYGWFGKSSDPWGVASQYLWQNPLWEQKGVGSSGANLTSMSGNVQTIIPPGALTSTVTMELWDVPPVAEPSAQLRSVGHSFWLRILDWLTSSGLSVEAQATTASFIQPITMTITYSDTETLHLDEGQLTFFRWSEDSNTWIGLPTAVDTAQNQAIAQSIEAGYFDLHAPLICPADIQEPNDNYYTASPITPNGASQSQLFDIAQDEDWFRLVTVVGGKYVISTSNLAAGADTVLQVYDMDGLTVLASDDNGGGNAASRLEWYAPASGSYFIRVTKASGSTYSCSANYSISATQELHVYLPLIQR
jgi:murein DD-endopeptidase MepM/ murein hydrolase activator NlpD